MIVIRTPTEKVEKESAQAEAEKKRPDPSEKAKKVASALWL